MTEEQLQVQCFTWHWNEYPAERGMLWHNNNNSCDARSGNKNKARGVVAGVSDMTLILAGGGVCMIEFKKPGGVQSREQKEFGWKVMERGGLYKIIYSFEEFKQLIKTVYE